MKVRRRSEEKIRRSTSYIMGGGKEGRREGGGGRPWKQNRLEAIEKVWGRKLVFMNFLSQLHLFTYSLSLLSTDVIFAFLFYMSWWKLSKDARSTSSSCYPVDSLSWSKIRPHGYRWASNRILKWDRERAWSRVLNFRCEEERWHFGVR